MIDSSSSLAALVAEHPSRAQVFERLQLDYCCGGSQTLAEACERRGLDADTVGELLQALDDGRLPISAPEERDWREATVAELCDHIVSVHHDGLRRDMPRISELLATVVRVHGGGDFEQVELRFRDMRTDLERHVELEERALFPACRALEAGGTAATLEESLIAKHEADHASVGEGLAEVRELMKGYDTSGALCGTHRALLDALRHFESDLHQHIHEENNVLFPRVRELLRVAGDGEADQGGDVQREDDQ